MLEGAGHHEVIDFSLDGRQLAVLHERSNFDQDVLVVDVAAATARNLTPHPTEGDVRYTSPRFTRDGRSLFVVSDRGREHMNLALLDLAARGVDAATVPWVDGATVRFYETFCTVRSRVARVAYRLTLT